MAALQWGQRSSPRSTVRPQEGQRGRLRVRRKAKTTTPANTTHNKVPST